MLRKVLFSIIALVFVLPINAQNATEKSVITLVNDYRAKEKLPPARYLADYFGIYEHIQTITPPADTLVVDIQRVINDLNSYLDLRLETSGVHVNYAAGLLSTDYNIAPAALVSIMRDGANSESIFFNYSIRTVLPITWTYTLYNKQILFIYLISFE